MKLDLYDTITNRIIAELEKGAAPWVKPWRDIKSKGGALPHNAVSGRPYSGVNTLLLWIMQMEKGYTSPAWLTFKQAKELGGTVRAGEKAAQIVFMKPLIVKDKDANGNETEEERSVTMLRAYWVFNVEQCDGLRQVTRRDETATVSSESDPGFAAWVKATGATVRHGGNTAAYSPALDSIAMPFPGAFDAPSSYRATMFHELGHWTGHKSRLDRNLSTRFGASAYAAEELIAELCSAYLCADHGVDGELRHAGYLGHWLNILKADKRAIFTAASAATKAAAFINEAVAQGSVEQRLAA